MDVEDTNLLYHYINEYQYAPLENDRMIRLLEFLPTSTHSSLQCKLVHVSLDDPALAYQALSYAWGAWQFRQRISVEGHAFSITRNLFIALKSFLNNQVAQEPRPKFWADAICIDQNNIPERNKQVAVMKEIYQKATIVVVHLGLQQPDDGSDILPESLRLLAGCYDRLHGEGGVDGLLESQTYPLRWSRYVQNGAPELWDPAWGALERFLNRPWFERTWILQEITLSGKIYVDCQGWVLPLDFDRVIRVSAWAVRLGAVDPCETSREKLSLIRRIRCDEFKPGSLPLIRLLRSTASSRASDPRDKVFAVLSLTRESRMDHLAADYNESLEQMLLRYAKYFVVNGDGLEMLDECYADEDDLAVPSWAPRWHSTTRLLHCNYGEVALDAWDRPRANEQVAIYIMDGDEILVASGFRFDEVVASGMLLDCLSGFTGPGEEEAEDEYSIFQPWFCQVRGAFAKLLPEHSQLYPTGQLHEQVIWRTLASDFCECEAPSVTYTEFVDSWSAWLDIFEFWRRKGRKGRKYNKHDCSQFIEQAMQGVSCSNEAIHVQLESMLTQTIPVEEEELLSRSTIDLLLDRVFISAFDVLLERYGICMERLSFSQGKRPFSTSRGYLGIGDSALDVGDAVVLITGCKSPFVMRRSRTLRSGAQTYRIIGSAYVHGISKGEKFQATDVVEEDIYIV